MGEFSLTHLLLLAVIFLIFFGPSRLPQLGQSLGKAIRGFKDGLSEIEAESKDVTTKDANNHQRLQTPSQNETAASAKPADSIKQEKKDYTS